MIDISYHFWFKRSTNLSDLLDQNFASEFRPRVPSPPPPPSAPNPHGHIGQEIQPPPTSAPQNTPEPMGPEWGLRVLVDDTINNNIIINHQPEHRHRRRRRHHHHHHPQHQQQQNPAPLVAEPAPEEEPRRPCCCFCYGRARAEAAAAGRPIPLKDDVGHWSDHHSMEDGVVVCPVLYEVVCDICGATAENAHTTDYHIRQQNLQRRNRQN